MQSIKVVAAIIKNEQHEIFCAQRKDCGELALKWEFPGGKIEAGETVREALIREMKEELNLTVKVKEYYMTIKHQYETLHVTMHAYACTIVKGTIALNEHNQYKWVSVKDLDQLDWAEADLPIVNKLMKKKK